MTEAVSYALAERMGRVEALALVRELSQRASEGGKPLRDVMLAEPRVKSHLSTTEIDKLFVPLAHLGSSQTFIDRLVYAAQPRAQRRTDFRPAEPRLPVTPTLPPVATAEPATPREPTPPPATVVAPEPAPAAASIPPDPAPAVANVAPAPPVATVAEPAPVVAAPESPAVTAPDPTPPAVAAPEPASPEPPTLQGPTGEAAPSLAAEPSPPGLAEPAPAARTEAPPAPSKPKPLPDEDAPGALMDVLWRAAEEERKRS